MTKTEALKKSCPLHRSSLCEASKCMAWQSTSQDEGFCQMVSRSRTMFVSSASPALRIDLEKMVGIKTDNPLEVRLVQSEYDHFEVYVKQ